MKILGKRTAIVFLLLITAACAGGKTGAGPNNVAPNGAMPAQVTDINVGGSGSSVEVSLKAEGAIQYTAFRMENPMRIVVDMSRVDLSAFRNVITVDRGPVKSIKPYYFSESGDSRLQINLKEDASYNIDASTMKGLVIQIVGNGPATAVPTKVSSVPSNASGTGTPVAEISTVLTVEDVQFSQVAGLSRVEVKVSDPNPEYELIFRDGMNRLTLDLPGAIVSGDKERLINVNLDESRVRNIALFQFRGGDDPLAKVVINLDDVALYNVVSENGLITIDIGDEAVLAMAMASSADSAESLVTEVVGAPEEEYTGARVSLDFQKADIHNILRILADVSGYNVITSDSVKGKVTMKLKDVPWDQALEVILRNNGLDKIMENTIIRVATVEEIQKEKEAEEKKINTERKIEKLYTRIFEINYESAANMKANIEALKSERGSVDINERTNILIVKDTKGKLAEISRLISMLDKKELQVLIESRIVEVTHQTARELGIQWGGFNNSVFDAKFPNTVGISGGTGVSTASGQSGLAVNLPTSASPAGAVGITLGHINGMALLDARLMALESSGMGRIVSMPRITTMNNKEAVIESGQEIPYQTVSAEGTVTAFKKATLSLKVTPHITPDRHIRLEIETHKDEPDFANQLPGAPPPILTKQAKTEVLVADGDTTVIGGLFKDTRSNSVNQVPGAGDIPFLGWLFKSDNKTSRGEELLIFITPKVVE